MNPTEQRTTLIELARAEARLTGLRLRVLAAADTADIAADSAADYAADSAATSTTA